MTSGMMRINIILLIEVLTACFKLVVFPVFLCNTEVMNKKKESSGIKEFSSS